jgi:hypothetical protein
MVIKRTRALDVSIQALSPSFTSLGLFGRSGVAAGAAGAGGGVALAAAVVAAAGAAAGVCAIAGVARQQTRPNIATQMLVKVAFFI